MKRGGRLPHQRATPRRKTHPVQPAWADPAPAADDAPTTDDFRQRVLDATSPRGRCAGTPGCRWDGPHEGAHAHHIHPRGRGGSDHTLNGAWLCADAHTYVHAHPAWAVEHGLTASWSPPWPD